MKDLSTTDAVLGNTLLEIRTHLVFTAINQMLNIMQVPFENHVCLRGIYFIIYYIMFSQGTKENKISETRIYLPEVSKKKKCVSKLSMCLSNSN